MQWLTEPWGLEFMRHAFFAALMVSVTCAILGVFIVLRRLAFVGDALAHASLPGLAGAFMLKINFFFGALTATLLTALGVGFFSKKSRVNEDSALSILFTFMFALGIFLMDMQDSFRDFSHMLFGNLLGVDNQTLLMMAGVSFTVLLLLWLICKEMVLSMFDPLYTRSLGLNPEVLRFALLICISLTVVIGVKAVGVMLISALMITPAAAARMLTHRFSLTLLYSALIASFSSILGLYLSFHYETPAGATIIMICTAFFFLIWLWNAAVHRKHS